MITVVLVVHLLIATALVGVILIQRSEGGALGGLGGGTFGGLMTARGSANLLTRTTAILAACFIGTSLVLALLASHTRNSTSILDTPPPSPTAPAPAAPSAPAVPTPGKPATPAAPSANPAPSQPAPTAPQPAQPTGAPRAPAEPAAPIAK